MPLSLLDQWITPVVRGRRAPPCSSFTLTSITNDSAILFGGATSKGDSNQLFAVYFTKSSVVSNAMVDY